MPKCENCGSLILGGRKLCDDCKHTLEIDEQAKRLGKTGTEKMSDFDKKKALEEKRKDKSFWWG